jgi:hypothetical protein
LEGYQPVPAVALQTSTARARKNPGEIHFEHEVEGLARPIVITAQYEAPDHSVGMNGGWFMVEAEMQVPPSLFRKNPWLKTYLWNRDDFEYVFGSEALQVAEEAAYEHYEDMREAAECDKAECDKAEYDRYEEE